MENTEKTIGAFVYNFERDSFQKTRIPAEQYAKAKNIVATMQHRTTTAACYALLSHARAIISAVELAKAIDPADTFKVGFELDPYMLNEAFMKALYDHFWEESTHPEAILNCLVDMSSAMYIPA